MKLIYHIIIKLMAALSCLLALWAVLFYFKMNDEVSDEVDDALQRKADAVMVRVLAGQYPADGGDDGTIRRVDGHYAASHPQMKFSDSEIYLPEYDDVEPVRELRTVFKDGEGRYYELTVHTPSFEKQDIVEAVASWTAVLYVVLLVVLLGVCAYVINRSLRPLYDLLRGLDDYKPGSGQVEVNDNTDVAEFRKLNSAARRAVQRSEEVFEQQKQFIGNASHELQTPLAVCRNRLEWLLDNTPLDERQVGEVLQVQRTLDYISRLNKSLLLLSKIDNGQFEDGVRSVNMSGVVKEQIEALSEIYASRGIVTEFRCEGEFRVEISDMLARMLAANLIKNAFVHTAAGGRIEVLTTTDGLRISNSSSGEALDADLIFRRFYHSGGSDFSGLGLAIVEAICRSRRLAVNYAFEDGMHVFRVKKE